MYSHEPLARETGLDQTQIDAIKAGRQPEGLDDQARVAYIVTKQLLENPGPLIKKEWDEALRVFGEIQTVGLLNFIGFYSMVCLLVNGVDAPVPEEADWKM